jgi:uncharacterized protein (UPF0333 family)
MHMSKLKAQAAMEYLMTYGWAILIVIIVVAALWAMGVFTTTSSVACSPCFSYFAFVDYAGGTMVLRNGPQEINITTVTGGTIPATTSYTAGKTITISGISTTGDVDVTITYTVTTSGLSHTDTATIHN